MYKWKFLDIDVHDYYADKDTAYPVAEVGDGSAIQWQNVNVANDAFDGSVFEIPDECTKGCNDLLNDVCEDKFGETCRLQQKSEDYDQKIPNEYVSHWTRSQTRITNKYHNRY